jgi:hypothetical protein
MFVFSKNYVSPIIIFCLNQLFDVHVLNWQSTIKPLHFATMQMEDTLYVVIMHEQQGGISKSEVGVLIFELSTYF